MGILYKQFPPGNIFCAQGKIAFQTLDFSCRPAYNDGAVRENLSSPQNNGVFPERNEVVSMKQNTVKKGAMLRERREHWIEARRNGAAQPEIFYFTLNGMVMPLSCRRA